MSNSTLTNRCDCILPVVAPQYSNILGFSIRLYLRFTVQSVCTFRKFCYSVLQLLIQLRLYARVDLGILSDITEMHQTTEQRQERVADIRAQLEEQISNMENFIFRVGSRGSFGDFSSVQFFIECN